MNDVIFKAEESGFGKRQFKIVYSAQEDKYYIKDLGDNKGTFVRVDKQIPIHQGNIFTFGEFHIAISYKLKQESDPDKTITIKLYESDQLKSQQYVCQNASEFPWHEREVSIGRVAGNTVRVKSPALSRVQCKLQYTDDGWTLLDGDGKKRSTNGTWLYVEDAFEVYDGMVVKAGDLLLKAYLRE